MDKLALVKFDFENVPASNHKRVPFTEDDRFVYLGDIHQMPGHAVVARLSDGRVFSAYHTENFVQLDEEDC